MSLTVHILADNNALPGFAAQWGFSCLLKTDVDSWLLDTGRNNIFMQNAKLMNLAPHKAKGVFLSHTHHDHTRGLPALLKAGFSGRIVGHPRVFRETTTPGTPAAGPGLMEEDLPEGMFLPVASHQVFPGNLTFITEIDRIPGNHQSIAGFSLDKAGTIPDTMPDDAFVLYESSQGPILLFGCCHSGIANSLACLRQRFGLTRVHSVLGGMHLHDAPFKVLQQTARVFNEFSVQNIYPGHCTGNDAASRLVDLCNARITPLAAGMSLVFD